MAKNLKQALAEQILETLQRQEFSNWYNEGGNFADWLTGAYEHTDPRCPTKEQILDDIKRLFRLER